MWAPASFLPTQGNQNPRNQWKFQRRSFQWLSLPLVTCPIAFSSASLRAPLSSLLSHTRSCLFPLHPRQGQYGKFSRIIQTRSTFSTQSSTFCSGAHRASAARMHRQTTGLSVSPHHSCLAFLPSAEAHMRSSQSDGRELRNLTMTRTLCAAHRYPDAPKGSL